jgi:hypothetical protein
MRTEICGPINATLEKPATPRERLLHMKSHLEKELERINEALTVMAENPNIEKVVNVLEKIRYI